MQEEGQCVGAYLYAAGDDAAVYKFSFFKLSPSLSQSSFSSFLGFFNKKKKNNYIRLFLSTYYIHLDHGITGSWGSSRKRGYRNLTIIFVCEEMAMLQVFYICLLVLALTQAREVEKKKPAFW